MGFLVTRQASITGTSCKNYPRMAWSTDRLTGPFYLMGSRKMLRIKRVVSTALESPGGPYGWAWRLLVVVRHYFPTDGNVSAPEKIAFISAHRKGGQNRDRGTKGQSKTLG